MNRSSDAMFDSILTATLDDLARGGSADRAVEAALKRTSRIRQRPAWLAFSWDRGAIVRPLSGPLPRLVLVGLLVLIGLIAIVVAAGLQRRPPPFGLAQSGSIAYEADGHLWLAGPNGSSPRQLTFGQFAELAPVWSRDGTMLAYRALTADEPTDDPARFTDLIVANADGTNPTVIESRVPFMGDPTWSADSRFIAFTRSISDGTNRAATDHLVVAAADGSRLVDLGDFGAGAWGPVWSPDGVHLAIAVGSQVMVVERDGSNPRVVTHEYYTEVGGQAFVGDWSPDGSTLAFAAGPPDQKRVYLVSMDGRAEVRIGDPDRSQTDPIWSPDGSTIAYLRAGIGLGPVVVIADRFGRDIRTLPGYYAWCTPVWSPDGRRIIVLDDRPGEANQPGTTVVLALDPAGVSPPIQLAAPPGPVLNDNVAGSWQRLAP